MPKFVTSTTLTGQLTWTAQLPGPDTAAAVAALKAKQAGSLTTYGCGALVTYLAHQGLVDEVRFWPYPVVWGNSSWPFHASQLPIPMRLITATPASSGVVKPSYQPLAA